MAALTPELEAALAPIATDTAQLLAVAQELRRRAIINRGVNFQNFANQLQNQVTITEQRQQQIRNYIAHADAGDEVTVKFGALLSLSETVRTNLVGMQRIVSEIMDSISIPTA